jgi:hypothetical protein
LFRHRAEKEKSTSADDSALNEIKLYGPLSLAFGGTQADNIYFEVEFCGVNNTDPFDIRALPNIHVGFHGTKGHANAAWTVTWNRESLDIRSNHN